ncbi:MAG: HsdM family class I SAM-dependent methyltransferase [Promethearchaeota archaeon]
MEIEKILYDLYTDPNISENERNKKIFSGLYPLFLNKTTGSFFTSPDIAKMVTERCFGENYFKNTQKVLDPACGVGEFLISAANQILTGHIGRKRLSTEEELEIRELIVSSHLFGFDIDERIIKFCKLRLLMWSLIPIFKKQPVSYREIQTRLKNFKCNIKLGDFFNEYLSLGKFDFILCNPPYNSEMLPSQESILKEKFPSIIRNSAAYFYLLCDILLESNGKMGFILPKSVAYSKRWRTLKNHILTHLDFIQDISKAFSRVKLEEIILITSKDSAFQMYTTQENPHNPIQVTKTSISSSESLILSLSPLEYEIFKQFSSIPGRLGEFINAYRGLNIQKLVEKNAESVPDPIYCLGGKEIKPFFIHPSNRIIRRSQLKPNLEHFKSGNILGQLANAHVKNPRPHYNLAFTKAASSSNWTTFDTIINISIKDLEELRHDYFIDYLLCFLNSDVFSWYLYKIVYAGAIRSTRLDAEYLNKVPFLPIQPKDQKLLNIFHLLASCLFFLSEIYYTTEKSNPIITEMLKKSKFVMNSLVFMLFFSKKNLITWLNSLEMDFGMKKSMKKPDDVSKILEVLWNSSYSKILQQLRTTKQWKIIIIK